MKTYISGRELSFALRQLKKELPTCERIILNSNGSLEIIGLDRAFKSIRVHAPCNTISEGIVNVDSFSTLYSLTQDKAIKETMLTLESEGERMLIRHDFALDAKKATKRHIGYSGTFAEYRLSTFRDPGLPVPKEAVRPNSVSDPEKAQEPGVQLPALQSVTIPSAALKSILPHSKWEHVTIAATSRGIFVLGTPLSLNATEARFSLTVPVIMLREAIKAGPNVRIGIHPRTFEWKGLKETHKHPGQWDERTPRRSFPLIETIHGDVNGIPLAYARGELPWNWERNRNTSLPCRGAIVYRDSMEVPAYRKHGLDSAEKMTVYSPWHYVRVLTAPRAIAEEHARRMSEKAGRNLESVYIYDEQEIVLEPEILINPQWEVLRVSRKRDGSYYEKKYDVFATFKIAGPEKECRVRIAREMNDDDSRALTKRLDLAAQLLNGEITLDELAKEFTH